ncbi:hypothetical protein [Amycolatopsis rhizosphaerae]|nr:hypothetical protein [Amycolatopsis rhizosphaerae]
MRVLRLIATARNTAAWQARAAAMVTGETPAEERGPQSGTSCAAGV